MKKQPINIQVFPIYLLSISILFICPSAVLNWIVKCCCIAEFHYVTLGKVLVQVELESSTTEAEDLGSLGQEAGEVQVILAQRVRQQEGPHFSSLAFWTRRSRELQAWSYTCM